MNVITAPVSRTIPPRMPVRIPHPGRVRSAPMQLLPLSPPISVGIPSGRLAMSMGDGKQHRSNWCWAACIQMVLNHHGLPVPQEALVARMFGGFPDLPQNGPGICAALTGWSVDVSRHPCRITADSLNLDNRTILDDLHRGNPLIVGLQNPGGGGHAYVLTGATFQLDQHGNPHINSVVLRDPWPDSPDRLEISGAEFAARATFATRVLVERV